MINTAYQVGTTGVTVYLRAFTVTTGDVVTSLTNGTSGLSLFYVRNRNARTNFTPAAQTVGGVWAVGGFIHVAAGVYRVDVPDAAFASGVDSVIIGADGVADIMFIPARVDLLGANPRAAVINVNVAQINSTTVNGNGTSSPWGP